MAILDQISSAIGRLQGEMEESHRQRGLLTEAVTENTQAIESLIMTVRQIEGRLQPIQNAQADIERWKNRGLGIFAGVVFVGTMVGNAVLQGLGKVVSFLFSAAH